MAVTIGRFSISITATSEALQRVFAGVRRESNRLKRNLDDIGNSLQGFALQGLAFGTSILAPLALTLKAAADLEETVARFDTVFGDNSKAVAAWAQDYSDAVGRAEGEVLGFLADFRTRFEKFNADLGSIAGDEISKSLTQAVVDVASFRNLRQEDVLTNFLSALSGESEAVRKFGIDISDAAIKAEAFARGFEDLTNLSQGTKELLRAKVILESVGSAQGDAIRTQDEFTNSWRRLQKAISETSVIIGNQLLPFVTQLVQRTAVVVAAVQTWVEQNPILARSLAVIGVVAVTASVAVLALATAFKVAAAATAAFGAVTTLLSGPVGIAVVAITGIAVAAGLALANFTGLFSRIREAFSTRLELPTIETNAEQVQNTIDTLTQKLDELSNKENKITLDADNIREAEKAAEQLQKRLESEAEQLEVSLRTPFEKFEAGLTNLRQLLENTNLNEEVARRQIAALRNDLVDAEQRLNEVRQQQENIEPVDLVVRGSQADAQLRQAQQTAVAKAEAQRQQQLRETRQHTRLMQRLNGTAASILDSVKRTDGQTVSLFELGVR